MTAITTKSKRKDHDFYATQWWATDQLLKHYRVSGSVLECCVGAWDIANKLIQTRGITVTTNDIDQSRQADHYIDLSTPIGWQLLEQNGSSPDWIVTNPPFCHAPALVPLAYKHAGEGIAMLLRLSFLEPCLNRAEFLAKHPPTKLIILPRISFTGDGKTDSVTCAWMIWDKREVFDKDGQIVIVADRQ